MNPIEDAFDNIIRPQGQFLRSAQLERDFRDADALEGYIITDDVVGFLQRVAYGLRSESGDRAFRIMGDYGSGKSSFALFLAHWLRGEINNLPQHIQSDLTNDKYGLINTPKLFPLLITGQREPLSKTIQRAIKDNLNGHDNNTNTALRRLVAKNNITGQEVLTLLALYRSYINKQREVSGVLLIIDESGKLLEYTANNPNDTDVFLWQILAEEATRSADEPFIVVSILHKGFSSYAHSLGLSQEKEWEKVAGRYSELNFRYSLEQSLELISAALNVNFEKLNNNTASEMSSQMEKALKLHWFGAVSNPNKLINLSPSLYPLDPFVIPVLLRFLHQFGQNERSVFSFLFGNEPNGLMAYLSNNISLFTMDNLYEYVHSNYDQILSQSPETSTWVMIKSLIAAASDVAPQTDRVLKALGIINLLNSNDLLPTEDVLASALYRSGDKKSIKNCIKQLKSEVGKRVLYDRGVAGGLCLWSHVSVDLHLAYKKASSAIGPVDDIIGYIAKYFGDQNLVARKHYIKSGSLRYYRVKYCGLVELDSAAQSFVEEKADGVLYVTLCKTETDIEKAEMLAIEFRKKINCVIAVTKKPINNISTIIQEALIWDYILTNTPELNNDPYAQETVSLRREKEHNRLADSINQIIGIGRYAGKSELKFFWKGIEVTEIKNNRSFSTFLTKVFDHVYAQAPLVRNELLNRDNLSAAAAGARIRLIEGLLERNEQKYFGMDETKSPPEMSMYRSIFEEGNIHISKATGGWFLEVPKNDDDKLNIRPTLTYIYKELVSKSDTRIPCSDIFHQLRQPPYGVKSGLSSLILAMIAIIYEKEIALYEDNCFISQLTGAEFLRLIKNPDNFEVQLCRVEGIRADFYNRLADILNVDIGHGKKDVLEIVRPLSVFAAQLPLYVHKTKRLSTQTVAVRDALLNAREPVKLLFSDLPKACGLPAIGPNDEGDVSIDELLLGLKESIHELRGCYYELRLRILLLIRDNFEIAKTDTWRKDLSQRAEKLFVLVAEPTLKAFCFRLSDDSLSDEEWGESIASLIVSKPPSQWLDRDESSFIYNLGELAARFKRAESTAFETSGTVIENALRICLTRSDGEERTKIISTSERSDFSLTLIKRKLDSIINEYGPESLIALSDILWQKMSDQKNGKN